MTDERYLYRTDVNEKKRTARGIHNKRTHNGKGGCKLPSDYLTRKERDAMNGSVIQYNLNKPMTLVELKKLPSDIQKEYLHTLIYDKGCKRDDLIEMLRTSNSTLHRVQKAGEYQPLWHHQLSIVNHSEQIPFALHNFFSTAVAQKLDFVY